MPLYIRITRRRSAIRTSYERTERTAPHLCQANRQRWEDCERMIRKARYLLRGPNTTANTASSSLVLLCVSLCSLSSQTLVDQDLNFRAPVFSSTPVPSRRALQDPPYPSLQALPYAARARCSSGSSRPSPPGLGPCSTSDLWRRRPWWRQNPSRK